MTTQTTQITSRYSAPPTSQPTGLLDSRHFTEVLDLFSPAITPAITPVMPPAPCRFQEGDQVLHARGPKHKEMLLVVLGYHSDTHARCRYVFAGYAGNKDTRKNPTAMAAIQIIAIRHLLDPHQFGITVKNARHESTPAEPESSQSPQLPQSPQVFTDKLIFDAHNCAKLAKPAKLAKLGHATEAAEVLEGAAV